MSTSSVLPGEQGATADERIIFRNVTWMHFETQLALRGDRSVPRMAYLDGCLELMSPSKDHEQRKSYIGRLIEVWALHTGIDLSPYGGWTLKDAPKEAGAEPDECYIVGEDQSRGRPHLAIEVIWTSGGLDKLEIYRRLDVGEVWIWRHDAIEVYVLGDDGYERRDESACLPGIPVGTLCDLLDRPTVLQAMSALREMLERA